MSQPPTHPPTRPPTHLVDDGLEDALEARVVDALLQREVHRVVLAGLQYTWKQQQKTTKTKEAKRHKETTRDKRQKETKANKQEEKIEAKRGKSGGQNVYSTGGIGLGEGSGVMYSVAACRRSWIVFTIESYH